MDHVEDTTRKLESMSEIVAEMVLGAFDDALSEAVADAAALLASRTISVASTMPAPADFADIDIDVDVEDFDDTLVTRT
jgi:hypothetical protein